MYIIEKSTFSYNYPNNNTYLKVKANNIYLSYDRFMDVYVVCNNIQ